MRRKMRNVRLGIVTAVLFLSGAACGMSERENNEPDAFNGFMEPSLGERLYELREPAEDAADFCGEWNRTQIHTGTESKLVITGQTNERFSFEMESYYFYHSGELCGEAWFVTPKLAIARFEEFGDKIQYAAFLLEEESQTLNVAATGTGFELYLGDRVWVHGAYCKGEPVYTNAGQFEAYFGGEIDAFMKETLSGEDYDDFHFTAEIGEVHEQTVVLADGSSARWLEGLVPTDGMHAFEIVVTEDGRIYAYMHVTSAFVTNDDGAGAMPKWEPVE